MKMIIFTVVAFLCFFGITGLFEIIIKKTTWYTNRVIFAENEIQVAKIDLLVIFRSVSIAFVVVFPLGVFVYSWWG